MHMNLASWSYYSLCQFLMLRYPLLYGLHNILIYNDKLSLILIITLNIVRFSHHKSSQIKLIKISCLHITSGVCGVDKLYKKGFKMALMTPL